jgi:hypothetical protein
MGHVQRSRAHRRRRQLAVGAVVLAVAGSALGIALSRGSRAPIVPGCVATAGADSYFLDPEQAVNAATIRATAYRLGLPDHAVTVALATALQESKLRNLTYGDRDSLGLFQQRPSQGWGTAAQVSEPTYAATAFFRALVKLPDWQTLSVADAAQRVQRSADGSAYAVWEPEARAFATTLTGELAAGLACADAPRHTPVATTAATVETGVRTALGTGALAPGVTPTLGWSAATYLMIHADGDGVASVSFAGQTWTAKRGTWAADPKAGGQQVTFALTPR